MKNIPNMISQFIASSDESRNYSLTKNELKRLRVYLDEYDIQVDIIKGITGDERGKNGMDGKKESDKRTPINDGNKRHHVEKAGDWREKKVTKAGH